MTTTTDVPPGPAPTFGALVDATRPAASGGESFRCESARTLRIDVDGEVWLTPGAAIAYRGDLTFHRRPTVEAADPIDAVLRETAPLVRAVGRGCLYCAHHGSHVRIVRLIGDAVVVAWSDLLAFERTLVFEPRLVAHGVGIAAGGLAAVRLSGEGLFAFTSHGRPLALPVTPEAPVNTDPHATVAWSDGLEPTLKTDLSWRSLVGHGGEEPFQMHFGGTGVVLVQPFEDPSRFHLGANPLKRLAAMVGG
ncbi:MAG: AIM24 family protein [Vicinamibacterales bacterium]